MWLTDLADACRASGLRVVEEPAWRTRGHGPMTAVRGLMWHHTAGPRSGNMPSLTVLRDGRPGLEGPLSQLGLARDGTVHVIAAGKAYHAGSGEWPGLTGNSDCIGIEAESVGDGTDWTPQQRDAMPRLSKALCARYRVPTTRVIAHREWAPTRKIDPAGIDMRALRAATAAPTPTEDTMPTLPEIATAVWSATFGRGDQTVTAGQMLAEARRDSAAALAVVRAVAARPAAASAIDPAELERIITDAADRVRIDVTVE